MCDNSSSRGTLSETNAGHFVAKFLYDGRGRMALEQRILGGTAYQLSYGYDALDRLTSAVYPNGDVLAYRYGDHGQTADLLVNIAPLVSGAPAAAHS